MGHGDNHPFRAGHQIPPIPGIIFPGMVQFASRPRASTCSPPRTLTSKCPPRISPKDRQVSKLQAPGMAPIGRPPASVKYGSSIPISGKASMPMMPFSDWKNTSTRRQIICDGLN